MDTLIEKPGTWTAEQLVQLEGQQLVSFKQPQELIRGGRRTLFSQAKLRFFIGRNNKVACYTFGRSSGYYLPYGFCENIECIKPTILSNDEKQARHRAFCLKVSKLIHPNAWGDLRDKLVTIPEGECQNGEKLVYTRSIFNAWEYEQEHQKLTDAFTNKTPYRWHRNGSKRDKSIEARLYEDGIYRAWYSSEFSGCGNGDYYLLVSPDVAVFCEPD